MVNSKDFVKRLEKLLDYYNFTATAFAEEIDFNRSTISHLLSGRNKPSLEFIMKVIQKFPEVTMDWLAFGKGSFPASEDGYLKNNSSDKLKEQAVVPDLFSAAVDTPQKKPQGNGIESEAIDRIVIFYKDGTFKSYKN